MSVPVCPSCDDTHRMTIHTVSGDERVVMCTCCPVPCRKCRQGGTGPYCERTPCDCFCHDAKLDKPTPRSAAALTSFLQEHGVGALFRLLDEALVRLRALHADDPETVAVLGVMKHHLLQAKDDFDELLEERPARSFKESELAGWTRSLWEALEF